MGTHPIFESDFDCLTDLCRFLSHFISKRAKCQHVGPKGVREVHGPGLRRCVSSDVRLDRRYGRKPTLEDQDAHQKPAVGRFRAARVEFRRKKAIRRRCASFPDNRNRIQKWGEFDVAHADYISSFPRRRGLDDDDGRNFLSLR